jgi:hypothetical protein
MVEAITRIQRLALFSFAIALGRDIAWVEEICGTTTDRWSRICGHYTFSLVWHRGNSTSHKGQKGLMAEQRSEQPTEVKIANRLTDVPRELSGRSTSTPAALEGDEPGFKFGNLNRFREGIHDFCDRQSFVYADLAGGKRRKGAKLEASAFLVAADIHQVPKSCVLS